MTYAIDQLNNLTKANLDFAMKLSDIARSGGQDSLQIGVKAIERLSDDVRSVALSASAEAALSRPEAGLGRGTALLGEIEAVRQRVVTDTLTAFDRWRSAWSAAFVLPETGPGELFTGFFQPWLNGLNKTSDNPVAASKPRAPSRD